MMEPSGEPQGPASCEYSGAALLLTQGTSTGLLGGSSHSVPNLVVENQLLCERTTITQHHKLGA